MYDHQDELNGFLCIFRHLFKKIEKENQKTLYLLNSEEI